MSGKTQMVTCASSPGPLVLTLLALSVAVPGLAWAQDEADTTTQTSRPREASTMDEPTFVDMTGPLGAEAAGGVSIDEIRWRLNRQRRALGQCFAGRIFNPQVVSGRVVVTFVISPSGMVTGASVTLSTIGDSTVEACVVQAIRRATFPRTIDALPLVVSYPVISREYLPAWTQPVVFASPERWATPDAPTP